MAGNIQKLGKKFKSLYSKIKKNVGFVTHCSDGIESVIPLDELWKDHIEISNSYRPDFDINWDLDKSDTISSSTQTKSSYLRQHTSTQLSINDSFNLLEKPSSKSNNISKLVPKNTIHTHTSMNKGDFECQTVTSYKNAKHVNISLAERRKRIEKYNHIYKSITKNANSTKRVPVEKATHRTTDKPNTRHRTITKKNSFRNSSKSSQLTSRIHNSEKDMLEKAMAKHSNVSITVLPNECLLRKYESKEKCNSNSPAIIKSLPKNDSGNILEKSNMNKQSLSLDTIQELSKKQKCKIKTSSKQLNTLTKDNQKPKQKNNSILLTKSSDQNNQIENLVTTTAKVELKPFDEQNVQIYKRKITTHKTKQIDDSVSLNSLAMSYQSENMSVSLSLGSKRPSSSNMFLSKPMIQSGNNGNGDANFPDSSCNYECNNLNYTTISTAQNNIPPIFFKDHTQNNQYYRSGSGQSKNSPSMLSDNIDSQFEIINNNFDRYNQNLLTSTDTDSNANVQQTSCTPMSIVFGIVMILLGIVVFSLLKIFLLGATFEDIIFTTICFISFITWLFASMRNGFNHNTNKLK